MKSLIKSTLLLFLILITEMFAQTTISEKDSSKGQLFFNIAEDFYRANKSDSSSIYYLKAANSFYNEENWKDYIMSLNYSALDYVYLSKYDTAAELLKKGIAFSIEKFGESDSLTAVLFNSLGSVYYNQGNYEDALSGYSLSLKIRQKLFGNSHKNTAASYLNVGLVWYWVGDYEKALEHYNRALAIWYPIYGDNSRKIGNCYINIANVYDALGDFEKSIDFDLKALSSWKSVLGENHRYIAMSYNNLAESYKSFGKHEFAIKYAKKSLELNQSIFGNEHPQIAKNITLIAKIQKNRGNLDSAQKSITEALNMWNSFPTNKQRYSTLMGLAEINLELNKYSEAIANFDSIISNVLPEALVKNYSPEKSFNLPTIRVNYLYAIAGKGDVYLAKYSQNKNIHELENALYWYKLYSNILVQIRKSYRRETSKLNLNKSIHDINKKLIGVTYKLYKQTGNNEYKSLAYKFNTNSKATVLSEAIAESGAKKFGSISDSLLKIEKELQKELETSYNNLARAEENGDQKSDLSQYQNEIFVINKTYDGLIKNFEQNFPTYYKLKYESKITTLEYIQSEILDSNSILIEYFISDTSTYIFAITNNSVEVNKTKSIELERLVKSFRSSLQNIEFEEYVESAHKLYETLIHPTFQLLQKKEKVYIIPDGILNYLPFEALLTKKPQLNSTINFSNLDYLINDFEIAYHYSSHLLVNTTNNKRSDLSFAGFAPVFSDSEKFEKNINNLIDTTLLSSVNTRSAKAGNKIYSALPYSEVELNNIVALFKKKNLSAKTFTHSQATEEVIKSEEIKEYNVIHIASHGFINEKRPKLSGILFWDKDNYSSEDAILYLGEIFNLNLNADLVVLSACESGLGKLVKGEGIIGLSRGFIYAGTSNIIMSLWQVADKSTSELMVEFYNYLLSGFDYSKSLRLAKLKLIKENKFSYPLEWSPFIIVGE